MEKKLFNVFWTGGWDSTFIMLQLSDKPVVVQPYYLKDNRKSEKKELETIETLKTVILNLETTRFTIRPLITKNVSDIEKDESITKAYKDFSLKYKKNNKQKSFGSQYEWLARFSKNIENLEMGVVKGSQIPDIIKMFGDIEQFNDGVRKENFRVNKAVSSELVNKVFGYYNFPLYNLSKLDMKKIAEDLGYIDIMNQTWFCHKPINNEPCGKCNPCMQTINFGLNYRFSKQALKRYKRRKLKKKIKALFK